MQIAASDLFKWLKLNKSDVNLKNLSANDTF
jgi:hypothetical protein